MEELTKTQLVLLVLLVSFVTSLVTGIVTATLLEQAPQPLTETLHKVVERVKISPEEGAIKIEEKIEVITQEDLIVKLAEETSPAVVSVIATKDVPVMEQYFSDPFGSDPFFRQFLPPEFFNDYRVPQYREKGTEKKEISSGTGFFVSREGFLITNRHVVEDREAEYSVIVNDGRRFPAKVLARDPVNDLAVLKTEGEFTYLQLGNSSNLRIGQTVVAIGNALGEFQNTVSVGVISGLRRNIVASGGGLSPSQLNDVIQTDAAINPGNSGGPLLDISGRVIGINSAVAIGAENVGFALPVNLAKKAISDVENFGEIRYAFLGVSYVTINTQIAKERSLSADYGALVTTDDGTSAVVKDSPAARAGIRNGDIILEIAGERVGPERPLSAIIADKSVGQKVSIKLLREGKESIIEVELAERPQSL